MGVDSENCGSKFENCECFPNRRSKLETFLKPVVAVSIGTNSGNDALNKTKKCAKRLFSTIFVLLHRKT